MILIVCRVGERPAFILRWTESLPVRPKLFDTLKNYSRADFLRDLMAGVIVGIVALPLAIAFGIASGVSPEKGIITAVIAGFVVSLLGGSRVQIGGPTGAFIIIVYGIVQQYGEAGLLVATLMGGVLLLVMGLCRLGTVIKFIPYPIIVGFTSGIAVTIFTTQVADLLGLDFGGEAVPGDFAGKWMLYFRHFGSVNGWEVAVSVASILLIALTPRVMRRIPGSLVAIVVMTLAVWLLRTYAGIEGIDTIGDRFTIHAELPAAALPAIDWEAIRNLFPVAVTIAILGAIESLLSATVADGVIDDRHDSNTELIAQGAHCIDLVSPTHFTPWVCEALAKPLPVPVVWNSGGYERVETLKTLEGRVQIYLPDLKYALEKPARELSCAGDYFPVAAAAIDEMLRQVGPYVIGEDGLMKSGVIIRHLVLPGQLENTKAVIDYVSAHFPPHTVLFSLMSQYTPQPGASGALARRLNHAEYRAAVRYMTDCGITDGFCQELSSAKEEYTPIFDLQGVYHDG